VSARVIELSSRLTRVQQDFVAETLPMVREIAVRIAWRCCGVIGWKDLLSIGNVALTEQVRTFDPSRKKTLREYAFTAVRGAMLDALRIESRLQKVVRQGMDKAIVVQADDEDMESFTDALVAGGLANLAGEPMRTDDAEDEEALREIRAWVRCAVSELSTEAQRLVELHYVRGMAIESAGREMGLGRTVVYARHRGLLKRLAEKLARHGVAK
jgi:RNA polymerase sigma factor FliA